MYPKTTSREDSSVEAASCSRRCGVVFVGFLAGCNLICNNCCASNTGNLGHEHIRTVMQRKKICVAASITVLKSLHTFKQYLLRKPKSQMDSFERAAKMLLRLSHMFSTPTHDRVQSKNDADDADVCKCVRTKRN
jgi:hypothetical protein